VSMNRISFVVLVASVTTFAAAIPTSISAQRSVSEPTDAVDSYIRDEMAKRQIPGLAVAVIRQDRIQKLAAYGTASLEFSVPVTTNTLFSVASVSKAFVGVGIMRLVEDRALSLEDPIGQHLDAIPIAWRSVTVRQLLNHTSGLPVIDVDQFSTRTLAQTVPAALQLLGSQPQRSPAGTEWDYNGTNYMLLGMLIEKVSGKTFVEFCRDRLFAPLGLTTPTFGDSRTVVTNRATVYTRFRFDSARPERIDRAEVLNYDMPSFAYPSAGLNISIADFSTWLVALGQGRLIGRQNLEELWKPATLRGDTTAPYGLGWVLAPRASRRAPGGTGGLRAAFSVFPDDDLSIILLTNFQGAGPEALLDGVAALYFAK
jgi:CubicO group peptidase (beta-lactamase class C family)